MLKPRRSYLVLSAIILLAATGPARSDVGANCTELAFSADLALVQDWNQLHSFYNRNHEVCPDDGYYAEGYSDTVVHTIAKRWHDLAQLQTLAGHDANFRSFVIKHINATADPDELNQALRNATTKCPAGATALCKDIAARARVAIRDL